MIATTWKNFKSLRSGVMFYIAFTLLALVVTVKIFGWILIKMNGFEYE